MTPTGKLPIIQAC